MPTKSPLSGAKQRSRATSTVKLRRILGLPALILFGLTYMAPVTVFTTYGTVSQITDNHLAAAYVVALATMIFTAISYARLSKEFPAAGSAYSYTQKSFGGHLGFMTGWTLMLDYLFLPMINFLLIGVYLNSQFPQIPAGAFALASLLLVLGLNVAGINFVSKMNTAVVSLSVLLVVVFIALSFNQLTVHGAPDILGPFSPSNGLGPIFSGAAILSLSFLGFDAVSTLSEEAKSPEKNIPRAIIITTLLGGIIFITVAWVGGLVFPDWRSFVNLDAAGADLMAKVGNTFFATFFVAIYVVGAFGSGMTTQVSVTRIIFAMGRDGLLPRKLGILSARFRTPVTAAVVVSVISLLCLVLTLEAAASMISFGALFAFSMVNLAVAKHFYIDTKRRGAGAVANYLMLPLAGFALTIWLWTSLAPISWIVGACWMALGAGILAWRTKGFRQAPPHINFNEGIPAE